MSATVLLLTLVPATTALLLVGLFLVYLSVHYAPIIGRIFEETPLFLPLRLGRVEGGECVRFTTEDGLELAGTYLPTTSPERVGVLVFCHEYLSDRWSFRPYLGELRGLGYDVFTFDFRNHGESAKGTNYVPLQWASDHEVRDLRAALAYLRSRSDADPAGVGLFGVSRGGSTALLVAADDPGVWGVITDGAFPTRGTMLAYILRWAEIYVSNRRFYRSLPTWIFGFAGWAGRVRSERRLNCRYPDVERAVSRLAPRPWLAIHGQKDAYIGPEIARTLFGYARTPKELWIVPGAKHNRCRQVAPDEYQARVGGFLARFAPRRELSVDADQTTEASPGPLDRVIGEGDDALPTASLVSGFAAQTAG